MKQDNTPKNPTWLDRVFQLEEMTGDGLCPVYLRRWTLLKLWSGMGLYLHHFLSDDWSFDFHDHPKRFISIGLWGEYLEHTPTRDPARPITARLFSAPWIRTFPARHIHRIVLVGGRPCWTLVFVLRTQRDWGFWCGGKWVKWSTYVPSARAKEMKACP